MKTLIIVRHGQTTADLDGTHEGRQDNHLTNLGVSQVECLTKRLKTHYSIDFMYSSPMIRTKETIDIINKVYNNNIVFDDLLMEWDNGLLAGLKRSEALIKYPPPNEYTIHTKLYETESTFEFRKRVDKFVEKLFNTHQLDNSNVLVVTHGGTINMILSSIFKDDISLEKKYKTGDTGIHVLEWINNVVIYKEKNSLTHLKKD